MNPIKDLYILNPRLTISDFSALRSEDKKLYAFDNGTLSKRFIVSSSGHNLLSSFALPNRVDAYPQNKAFLAEAIRNNILCLKKQVANNEFQINKIKPSFMLFKLEILSPNLVNRLAKNLVHLTQPMSVKLCLLLVATALCLGLFYSPKFTFMFYTSMDILLVAFLTMLAILIHELGHAISAYRYGARRVSIGIGWYFIFPVAYADLSESWGFSVRQRMLSTIAGVFYQAVFGSLIFIGFLVTENMCFYSASIAILISILWNLNPFLRLDGYWLIVDLLDNPNLRKEGITSAKRLFKTPVSAEIKKTSIIVLVYGVISLLLLTFLLVKLSLEIYQTKGFGIYEIIKHVTTSDNLGIADWVLYLGTSLWKGLALIFLSWQAYLYVQKKVIKQRTSH